MYIEQHSIGLLEKEPATDIPESLRDQRNLIELIVSILESLVVLGVLYIASMIKWCRDKIHGLIDKFRTHFKEIECQEDLSNMSISVRNVISQISE